VGRPIASAHCVRSIDCEHANDRWAYVHCPTLSNRCLIGFALLALRLRHYALLVLLTPPVCRHAPRLGSAIPTPENLAHSFLRLQRTLIRDAFGLSDDVWALFC
jgi:hypothetical protein